MWRVEHDPERALLELRALRVFTLGDVDQLAREWVRALAATAGQPTMVFFDLRGLEPLEGDAVSRLQERVKRPTLALPHVQHLVILVDSAICMLQQRHALLDPMRETLTKDPEEARALLERH